MTTHAPAPPRPRTPASRRSPAPWALHPGPSSWWPHLLLGLLFGVLYSVTLAPGLLPADAGEYQLTGTLLGVAHPPGFALYTLLSWLISRLPGLSPATAINWLSALSAAGAIALVSRAAARVWDSPLAGMAGAALLGLSTTFWAQATTANIRMPAALAVAWALERLLHYRAVVAEHPGHAAEANRALAWLALALGLGVSHHASLVFILAVLGLYALWLRPSALRRPWPLLAAAAPFLAWLYFPLRAGAFGAPPGIATLSGFLEHILALGFRGDLFFFANPSALPARLALFGNILSFEFQGPLLALMGIGAVAACARSRSLGLALLLAAGVHVLVAITYRAPQTVEYLLPAYVCLAVWAAGGVATLARAGRGAHLSRRLQPVLPLAAALAAAWALASQWQAAAPSYRALARQDSTRAYAEQVLNQAPPDAVILATWHWATPLWYLQQVEGRRPDVAVRYVFPQGESLAQNWVDEISQALPARPVVVTSFYGAEFGALPYHFVPLGPAWEVRAEPLTLAPPGLTGAQTFAAWNFLGYQIEASSDQGLSLRAAWQGTATGPEDIAFFVHLLGPDGSLHSQKDFTHGAGAYAPGEVLLDRYTLALAPNAPPGTYRLVAGAYRPSAPGTRLAEVALTALEVAAPQASAVHQEPNALPLGSAMWLAGAEIVPAGPARTGDSVRVRLRFVAARPLTVDYAVSVSLVGPDFRWQVQSDGTPAGGAIPTLKWIAGSRVTDTHTLRIPADAAPGPAVVYVVVYDSFTQQPLGEAVRVGEVEVIGN